MKTKILKASLLAAFLFLAAGIAVGQGSQNKTNAQNGRRPSTGASAAATAARVPLIIVGSAAKVTWVTTKFTAKHFAAPVAKTLLLKAMPMVAKFALTHGLPFAAKLSMF